MDQFWYEVALKLSHPELSVTEDILQQLGALSISLEDAGDQALLEPAPGEQPTWDHITVKALFEQATDTEFLLSQLRNRLPETEAVHIEKVENRCWERVWMENFKPLQFGKHLWIYPSHIQPPPSNNDKIVTLDPGLAFGTGTHSTTALCLRWLDTNPPIDKTVVDYGCGSGVLAIAALKLGAQHVYATDIDSQALNATIDNATRNHVSEKLSVCTPEQLMTLQVDTVLANILSNTLIGLTETLSKQLKPGGDLILSGILREQADEVIAAYESRFKIHSVTHEKEWALVHAEKKTET